MTKSYPDFYEYFIKICFKVTECFLLKFLKMPQVQTLMSYHDTEIQLVGWSNYNVADIGPLLNCTQHQLTTVNSEVFKCVRLLCYVLFWFFNIFFLFQFIFLWEGEGVIYAVITFKTFNWQSLFTIKYIINYDMHFLELKTTNFLCLNKYNE